MFGSLLRQITHRRTFTPLYIQTRTNTYKREVNVKCPPCPPCARCPEPAFDCKRVPVYRESDDRYLPRPVLSDFSTFGM